MAAPHEARVGPGYVRQLEMDVNEVERRGARVVRMRGDGDGGAERAVRRDEIALLGAEALGVVDDQLDEPVAFGIGEHVPRYACDLTCVNLPFGAQRGLVARPELEECVPP